MKQSNFTWVRTVTDENGAYRFTLVPSGDAELRAIGMARQAAIEVGQAAVVDFESAAETGTIEGRVTYRGAAPMYASVSVVARGGGAIRNIHASVEADGSYRALEVPAGPCKVKITARGDVVLSNATKFFDVDVQVARSTRLDADIVGGAAVSGVVSGKRYYAVDSVYVLPGEIAAPEPLTLNAFRDFERIVVGDQNLDEGGEFLFEGLEPGVYTVVGCSFLEESPEAFESAYIGLQVVELTSDQETVLEIVTD
jgi:hypothetical protein